MRESRRYLGLELAGAKNQKTALAVLEYYPVEGKIFVLDIFERVVSREKQSSDEALLELIGDFQPEALRLGVNVPLTLPPCIGCVRKTCLQSERCSAPPVRWMREMTRRAVRMVDRRHVREFTPYTQRPVELYVRYSVLPKLPEAFRFEVDEALGGNKAPLTARMDFLKRHLSGLELVEAWPKLSVSLLAAEMGISRRTIAAYRRLEEGVHAREEILETLAAQRGVFIYERDVRKLSQNLAAFDAFICAFTALLSDLDECAKPPKGFPLSSGWIQYPKVKPKAAEGGGKC